MSPENTVVQFPPIVRAWVSVVLMLVQLPPSLIGFSSAGNVVE